MTRTFASILGDDLKACWHAEDLSAVGDGNIVTSWPDQVAGYDFANSTGSNEPTWQADDLARGYPAVRFDSTANQYLTLTNAALNFPSGCLIFLIMNRSVLLTVQTIISNFTDASNYTRLRDQSTLVTLQDSGGFYGAVNYVNANNPMAIAVRYQSGRSGYFTLSPGNETVAISTNTTAGTPHSSDTWYLGKRGDATTQPWSGGIHACILAAPTIDTRTILEVLTQLRYNYGITDSDSEPVEPVGGGGGATAAEFHRIRSAQRIAQGLASS